MLLQWNSLKLLSALFSLALTTLPSSLPDISAAKLTKHMAMQDLTTDTTPSLSSTTFHISVPDPSFSRTTFVTRPQSPNTLRTPSLQTQCILSDVPISYFQAQICTVWNVANGHAFDIVPLLTPDNGAADSGHLFGSVGQRQGVPEPSNEKRKKAFQKTPNLPSPNI